MDIATALMNTLLGMGAVSYTHLDVYKRQYIGIRAGSLNGID